jgi:hypothetical protein
MTAQLQHMQRQPHPPETLLSTKRTWHTALLLKLLAAIAASAQNPLTCKLADAECLDARLLLARQPNGSTPCNRTASWQAFSPPQSCFTLPACRTSLNLPSPPPLRCSTYCHPFAP